MPEVSKLGLVYRSTMESRPEIYEFYNLAIGDGVVSFRVSPAWAICWIKYSAFPSEPEDPERMP